MKSNVLNLSYGVAKFLLDFKLDFWNLIYSYLVKSLSESNFVLKTVLKNGFVWWNL